MRTSRCKQPGGCAQALRDYLAARTGTIREIAEATGYAYQSVENELAKLRHGGSPLVAGVVDARSRRRKVPLPPAELPRLPVENLVLRALATRTALEEAWA